MIRNERSKKLDDYDQVAAKAFAKHLQHDKGYFN